MLSAPRSPVVYLAHRLWSTATIAVKAVRQPSLESDFSKSSTAALHALLRFVT